MSIVTRYRGYQIGLVVLAVLAGRGLLFGYPFGGGSGTLGDPYRITTPDDLHQIGLYPNYWNKYFRLMLNIDMSEYGWFRQIGTSPQQPFRGNFDGNGRTISNLNWTLGPDSDTAGLFGFLEGASIHDLRLENITLAGDCYSAGLLAGHQISGNIYNCSSSGMVSGTRYVGGLVGVQDGGLIELCSSTATVSCSSAAPSGSLAAGGLVGFQGGWISGSCSSGTVSCSNSGTSYSAYAGGIAGEQSGGLMIDSYSISRVEASAAATTAIAGGVVGRQFAGTVKHCYSTGAVYASSMAPASSFYYRALAGGLAGYQHSGTIIKCYSIGTVVTGGTAVSCAGGLSGSGGNVINSFWDIQRSGLDVSAGGFGRTTAEMMTAATYIGWNDQEGVHWRIRDGAGYPYLAGEDPSAIPLASQVLGDFVPGEGTAADPYRISTPEQLIFIGLFAEEWDKVFCLESDLDLSLYTEAEFNRIGVSIERPFTGLFEGNGHVIRNLSYTVTAPIRMVGLFGCACDATIRNLRLENVTFSTTGGHPVEISGWTVGALAAHQIGGAVTHCSSMGTVTGQSGSSLYAGGLIGCLEDGSLMNCSSQTTVSGSSMNAGSSDQCCAGGLVGYQWNGCIDKCFSTGAVGASFTSSSQHPYLDSGSHAGGLVGLQESGLLCNSYSTGAVESTSSYRAFAGGLAGYQGTFYYGFDASIENCYSIGSVTAGSGRYAYVGGLLGCQSDSSGTVSESFWDVEASGTAVGIGYGYSETVYGKTTEQMHRQGTFTSAGWDFARTWVLIPYQTYPYLRTSLSADLNEDGHVNLADFVIFSDQWLEGTGE